MPRKPITCLDLNITSLPPRAPYFIAAVWRGDWTTNDCRCRNYYRPSRASLLRVNRAQRLLIQRVVNGYVAAPTVTTEPESNTELSQLVTTEFEAAALVADDFERALDERAAQGVTVAERIERR